MNKKFRGNKKLDNTKIKKEKIRNKNKLNAISDFYFIAFDNNDNVINKGKVNAKASIIVSYDNIEEYDNEVEFLARLEELK